MQCLAITRAALNTDESGFRETLLYVVFGTKGCRPRDIHVIEPKHVLHVINNALAIMAQQNGKLIDKPSLKQAMNYWRNSTYRLGLTGQLSTVFDCNR